MKFLQGIVWQATVDILLHPSVFFSRLRVSDLLRLAILLQISRWAFLSWVTMSHFHLRDTPTLLPVPFGFDLRTYRIFEIIGYFPYGMAMVGFIAYETWIHGRDHAPGPMSFSKTWQVVAFAYFAPWLPTALLDHLLLVWDLAQPYIVIPLHVTVVAASAALTEIGLRYVFDIPRKKARTLGLFGAAIFLVLAGLVVR